MMIIDKDRCIGCEKCVKDCFPNHIEMVGGKARMHDTVCMKCGHCIAVCPQNAVSMDDYNMKEVKAYNKEEFFLDADHLLNFIKFRRTVRQFKNKEVEEEKLSKIIEAGRFTQTGSNMQDPSYIVVRQGLQELKDLTMAALSKMGEDMLADMTPENSFLQRYAKMWINMYEAYQEDPKENDKIFFNAPAVIIVVADSQVNGALASSNMELMTNALGLGTFFSGFFVRAAQGNKAIEKFLGMKEGKQIVTCMVLGYANVNYLRTVPRKDAEIDWR